MRFILPFVVLLSFCSCKGQEPQPANNSSENATSKEIQVGGSFENGDFLYVDMPDYIDAVDTCASWNEEGQKMRITGTIYQADGKTPASGVILYYYHTDVNGIYALGEGLNKKVQRHGFMRGWVQTGEDGRYSIYTIRPGSYPNSRIPAHIHLTIKESGLSEYYIDDILFDDDPFLNKAERNRQRKRGGNGIVKLSSNGDLLAGSRDIILGQNIPGYPENRSY